MAALTTQSTPHAGLNVTLTPSLGGTTGNTAPTGAGLALLFVNGAAATVNVDMLVPAGVTVDGLAVATPAGATGPARRVVLPATIGQITLVPLVQATYGDPVTGLVTFNVAAGTVSAAVVVTQ
jgi:hypothetical protein